MQINKSYPCNKDNYGSKRATSDIKFIVIHYTGNNNDTAINNCKYFQSPNRNASAHYFVDETSIYQSVADDIVAWSVGAKTYYHDKCRNSNSISIEMCNSVNDVLQKTKDNVRLLVAQLMQKYHISSNNIIRHYDVTHKRCPLPLLNNDKWTDFKNYICGSNNNNNNDYINALHILMSKGIITSPDIWKANSISKNNIECLIIKCANKLK